MFRQIMDAELQDICELINNASFLDDIAQSLTQKLQHDFGLNAFHIYVTKDSQQLRRLLLPVNSRQSLPERVMISQLETLSNNMLVIRTHQKTAGALVWQLDHPSIQKAAVVRSRMQLVAEALQEKFSAEFNGVTSPFALLKQRYNLDLKLNNHSNAQSLLQQIIHFSKMEVPRDHIGYALAYYHQLSYFRYLPGYYQPLNTIEDLNADYLRRNNVVPVTDAAKKIYVLCFDVSNQQLLDDIQMMLQQRQYQLVFALPEVIQEYLELALNKDGRNKSAEREFEDFLETGQGSSPYLLKLVDQLFANAFDMNASDIHIDPPDESDCTQIRYRIDGICHKMPAINSRHYPAVVTRIKIMANLDIAEKRLPQDGKLSIEIHQQKIDARVATVPTVTGEGLVIRFLQQGRLISLPQLRLSEHNYQRITQQLQQPHGMILVVGATGSGKTTSLHALLSELNTPERKICTAEDPVEITQQGLLQLQVKPKIGLTFESAIRCFLRADPDVILIGEMRDQETAKAAIQASLTGHLVLSTLHTNSAPETISRLLDLGVDPISFADACKAILAQRLVRSLCNHCKEEQALSEQQLDYISTHHPSALDGNEESIRVFQHNGCEHCNYTGFKGRIALHELLVMNQHIKHHIYNQGSLDSIASTAKEQGMRTLIQDAIEKLLLGEIEFAQLTSLPDNS